MTDHDRAQVLAYATPAGGRRALWRRAVPVVAILFIGLSGIMAVGVARVQQERARQAEAMARTRALQLQYLWSVPTTSPTTSQSD